MQPHLVHQLVHDECRARHISRILHKRDEQVKYEYLRNEYCHAAHSAHYTVYNKVLYCSCRDELCGYIAQPCEKALYPPLGVCSKHEYRTEHYPHDKQEYGKSQPTVGNKTVNATCLLLCILVPRFECLVQSTVYKTVFGSAYGSLGICTHLCLHSFCSIFRHSCPSCLLHAVAQLPSRLLVALKQFQSPIAHRELRWQVIGLVQFGRKWNQLLLYDVAVVDVYVPYCIVFAFEQLYYSVQQLVKSLAVPCYSRYHRNTHHGSQVLVVYLCAAGKQFIVHVERNDSAQVHVNEFSGEI